MPVNQGANMFDSEEQGPVPARSFNGNGTSSRFGSGGIGWYSEDKDPHILLNNLAGPQSSTQAIMETKKVGNNTVTTTTTTTASTATTGTNACSVSTRRDFLRTKKSRRRKRKKLLKRKQPFCLKATVENFSTFCSQTSLHGWQYIAQKHTSTPKHIFWAVIVSLSMATAALFLYNNTVDYFNATVVTTVDTMTVPLSEVFFPSVVVCNINQVRKSFFEELGIYDNETFIRQIYFDFIEGKSSAHGNPNANSEKVSPTADGLGVTKRPEEQIALHEKILKEYLERMNETTEAEQSINWVTHQKCKDMFILSKWNATTTYNFEIDRDFGTDYGICCWYTPQLNFTEIIKHQLDNKLSDPDWGYWFTNIQKGAKTGKDNGYTMLFDIESFDYSYYDEGSEGLKVALVHHLDMPIMRQTGFHIAPGTENQIAVTPTLIVTSENAMLRFTPAERDCYSEDEISLKYLPRDHGYRYEMSNCLFESAFENILEKCKCFPGFHTMGGEHAMEHYDVCIGPNLTCMNDLLNRMGQFDHVEYKGEQVKCRSNCEDQINSLFVTTSNYPNRKTLVYREEFCIVAKRLIEKCEGPKRKPLEREYPNICSTLEPLTRLDPENFCKNNYWDIPRQHIPNCTSRACPVEEVILGYARENLVMFNIFIKDPYAKRFQKDEKITKTSYIANSGGLLGLCMGFSLISGAEILFHCFFGICSAIFPTEKQKNLYKKESTEDNNSDVEDVHNNVSEVCPNHQHCLHCDTHQVHNTCCFLPPPPPPPSTSLSKNSIHKHFSLSSDVLAENTAPGEILGGDLSESYPAHLNYGGRCPYHQDHRHKSHCWQNHCCVMSTNLQHRAEEPQPGGGNYAYPRRPHSSLEAESNSVAVPVGGLRKPEQCSDRYSQNHGLLPGSSAEVVFDGASSTTTLLRSHHHPVKKSLCQNSQNTSGTTTTTNGNPNRMFVGPERII